MNIVFQAYYWALECSYDYWVVIVVTDLIMHVDKVTSSLHDFFLLTKEKPFLFSRSCIIYSNNRNPHFHSMVIATVKNIVTSSMI